MWTTLKKKSEFIRVRIPSPVIIHLLKNCPLNTALSISGHNKLP